MRVVYLSPIGALCGAEHALLNLLASLRQARGDLKLHLICCTPGPFIDAGRSLDVSTSIVPIPRALAQLGDSFLNGSRCRSLLATPMRILLAARDFKRYARELASRISQIKPDIVHSNGIKCHVLSRWLGATRVPIVWHLHDFLDTRPLAAKLLGPASNRVSAAIAVSRAVAESAQKVLSSDLPIHVLHNAVDIARFSPHGSAVRLPDCTDDSLRVGLVSTYARWKGHDVFLQAAAHLVHRRPLQRIHFYIIGSPIYLTNGSQFSEAELNALAAQYGIRSRVTFIKYQRDLAAVYRGLDIVVHASTRPEPFGMTIVEAMSSGRPVIAVNAGGAQELFTPDHDALAVPPNNSLSLAAVIQRLCDDGELRRRLAIAARQTAAARFSHERLGPAMLDIYRQTLSEFHGH